jgi:phenylpropionate dioxygenase-like ring-hydroxylating dioxygenase large terminal subunit
MLSKEDNDLLCRVGPGTPMGNLLREYWIPALPSTEFPAPDSAPKRMRLLGENLVMFRDTNGDVGAFKESCPHRGASLFFGRNEETGLRCVYHGWKFDVSGACVDMPSEPAESNFKSKVRIGAYPARDVNHMVWVYMGPREVPPPIPQFEVNLLPPENVSPEHHDGRGELGAEPRGRSRLEPPRLPPLSHQQGCSATAHRWQRLVRR